MSGDFWSRLEHRGWKDICRFLGCGDKRTAKKRLADLGLLVYEHGRPVLNVLAYQKASLRRHITE